MEHEWKWNNSSGFVETYNVSGKAINLTGAFFQSFGGSASGRFTPSCETRDVPRLAARLGDPFAGERSMRTASELNAIDLESLPVLRSDVRALCERAKPRALLSRMTWLIVLQNSRY